MSANPAANLHLLVAVLGAEAILLADVIDARLTLLTSFFLTASAISTVGAVSLILTTESAAGSRSAAAAIDHNSEQDDDETNHDGHQDEKSESSQFAGWVEVVLVWARGGQLERGAGVATRLALRFEGLAPVAAEALDAVFARCSGRTIGSSRGFEDAASCQDGESEKLHCRHRVLLNLSYFTTLRLPELRPTTNCLGQGLPREPNGSTANQRLFAAQSTNGQAVDCVVTFRNLVCLHLLITLQSTGVQSVL
eukprot:scpid95494/ scgid13571/ 